MIWLVRHGQTSGNDEGWVQGRVDTPLNEKGREQAGRLAERLAQVPLQAIYCSPLSRARDTADVIGQRSELPVLAMEELAEIEMGVWERRPFRDVTSAPQALGDRWVFGPDRHLLGSEETLEHLVARAGRAIAAVRERHREGDVCLVAHAGILLGIIGSCLGLSDGTFLPSILIGNASVSLLEHRLGRWLLLFANDQHHLEGEWRAPNDMLLMLFGRPEAVRPWRETGVTK
jgi:broad specificity phosphatase PhoE